MPMETLTITKTDNSLTREFNKRFLELLSQLIDSLAEHFKWLAVNKNKKFLKKLLAQIKKTKQLEISRKIIREIFPSLSEINTPELNSFFETSIKNFLNWLNKSEIPAEIIPQANEHFIRIDFKINKNKYSLFIEKPEQSETLLPIFIENKRKALKFLSILKEKIKTIENNIVSRNDLNTDLIIHFLSKLKELLNICQNKIPQIFNDDLLVSFPSLSLELMANFKKDLQRLKNYYQQLISISSPNLKISKKDKLTINMLKQTAADFQTLDIYEFEELSKHLLEETTG